MSGSTGDTAASRALARDPGARRDPSARRDRGIGVATALVMGALVVLVYAAAVGVERLFGRTGPPGLVLSVVVTAVVALAFEPVRVRTRLMLTRLTHGGGPSRAQVLAGFADSVAGRYPIAELPQHIAAVVGEGTGARRTEVWLLVNGRLERAASWTAGGAGADRPGTDSGEAEGGLDRHELDVSDRGELFGRLTMLTAPGHRLSSVERRLVEGVAAQSGLLLRVSGLRVERQRRLADLEQRSNDLRRARRDLVTRQDAERKRLERNIHDGAQQEVIALLVNLRLVQTLLGRASDRAVGLLGAQADSFSSTIDSLAELAQGLYPRTLTEDGPVPALRVAAGRSPVPVTLTADTLPRLPTDREATLYFCAVEAMQNAAKHAAADQIRIDIRDGPGGHVRMVIADDGRGFDESRITPGRGLANVRDRVESVGGRLRLTSSPGRGTTLDIELPASSTAPPGAG
ncbi:MAG TPA: ATP-binding protein [Nakamurella sp.]